LAVRNLLRRSSAVVRPYGKMSGTLDDGFQANHLNQNAAYKSIIPENEGAALGLRGNAFTEPGTPHYRFHESLEKFWDQYRRGGAKYPQVPTNAEYSQGLKEALRASGLSQRDAAAVEAMARTNREAYGLSDTDPVPRIPRKIYQRGQ